MNYYYVNIKILVQADDEAAAMEAGLDCLRHGAREIPAEASIHSQATDEQVRATAAFWRRIEEGIGQPTVTRPRRQRPGGEPRAQET